MDSQNLVIKTLTALVADIQLCKSYKEEYDTEILKMFKFIKTISNNKKKFNEYSDYLKSHIKTYTDDINKAVHKKKVSKTDYIFLENLDFFNKQVCNLELEFSFKDIISAENKNTKRIIVEYCYNLLNYFEPQEHIVAPENIEKGKSKGKGKSIESLFENKKLMDFVSGIASDMTNSLQSQGVNNEQLISEMISSLNKGDLSSITKNKVFSGMMGRIEEKITSAINNGEIDTNELDVDIDLASSLKAIQNPNFLKKVQSSLKK